MGQYHGRAAIAIENAHIRVTVLEEGGHIAEIRHKATEVNPLWTPPWRSIEPSAWNRSKNPEYGDDAESKLLAGIMGHNLCLDLFGAPSEEEAAAGVTVHGEASVARYDIEASNGSLRQRCVLAEAGLIFERRIVLNGSMIAIDESVINVRSLDRAIAWTQHVTIGPPFLERGKTQLRAPAVNSYSLEGNPERDWSSDEIRTYTNAEVSGGFTTHLMDEKREKAYFLSYSPSSKILFGYVWRRSDFPWLGIWEENRSRKQPPWNGETLTWGLEFGASPLPECRRKMIDRNRLGGAQTYRWVPARSEVRVRYCAFITAARSMPNNPDELSMIHSCDV